MADTRRLDFCNCFASRKAARLITKMYEDHLAPARLTSSQFALMVHVDDTGGAALKDLADVLGMERTSVVRALQPLERDGLVATSPDPEDTRRNLVRLTAAGRRRLEEALPLWQAAQTEFEKKFGEDAARGMRESVRRVEP